MTPSNHSNEPPQHGPTSMLFVNFPNFFPNYYSWIVHFVFMRHQFSWNSLSKTRAFDRHLCQGSGEFDYCLGGARNLNQKCKVSFGWSRVWQLWFDRCNLSYSEMDEFKGKERAFLIEWLVVHRVQKLHVFWRHNVLEQDQLFIFFLAQLLIGIMLSQKNYVSLFFEFPICKTFFRCAWGAFDRLIALK